MFWSELFVTFHTLMILCSGCKPRLTLGRFCWILKNELPKFNIIVSISRYGDTLIKMPYLTAETKGTEIWTLQCHMNHRKAFWVLLSNNFKLDKTLWSHRKWSQFRAEWLCFNMFIWIESLKSPDCEINAEEVAIGSDYLAPTLCAWTPTE